MTEEEYDIQQHKQITAKRNFDKVNFGQWQIKTWYVSFRSCRILMLKPQRAPQVLLPVPALRDRTRRDSAFCRHAHPRCYAYDGPLAWAY